MAKQVLDISPGEEDAWIRYKKYLKSRGRYQQGVSKTAFVEGMRAARLEDRAEMEKLRAQTRLYRPLQQFSLNVQARNWELEQQIKGEI